MNQLNFNLSKGDTSLLKVQKVNLSLMESVDHLIQPGDEEKDTVDRLDENVHKEEQSEAKENRKRNREKYRERLDY